MSTAAARCTLSFPLLLAACSSHDAAPRPAPPPPAPPARALVAPTSASAATSAPAPVAPAVASAAPAPAVCEPACAVPSVCSQGRCAIAVEAAPDQPCVRLDTGSVRCWAEDRDGVPIAGSGKEIAELTDAVRFVSPRCVARASGGTACIADGRARPAPPPWEAALPVEARGFVAIDGYDDACAVMPEGHVLCWGENREGEIGIGAIGEAGSKLPPTRVLGLADAVAVARGVSHVCALTRAGRVTCWGSDECGNLGGPGVRASDGRAKPGPPLNIPGKVVLLRVAAMGGKGVALTDKGEVWSWGRWCIGIRNVYTHATPPKEIARLRGASSVSASTGGGFAVFPDGRVVAFVDDENGRPASFHEVAY